MIKLIRVVFKHISMSYYYIFKLDDIVSKQLFILIERLHIFLRTTSSG